MRLKSEIDAIISQHWTKIFNITEVDLNTPGTIVQEKDNLKGKKAVTIWNCGKKTVVRIDPDLNEIIQEFVNKSSIDFALTGEYFADYFKHDKFGCESINHIMYLYPDDFQPHHLNNDFAVRRLTIADKHAFDEMSSHCSGEDLNRGYIELEHEIVIGVFKDNLLVSLASVLDWDAFYDVGVLTHPDYRGGGLGRAAVSSLVEEILKTDKIPLYRCQINLFGSKGVALSLGFKENRNFVYKQECYRFFND